MSTMIFGNSASVHLGCLCTFILHALFIVIFLAEATHRELFLSEVFHHYVKYFRPSRGGARKQRAINVMIGHRPSSRRLPPRPSVLTPVNTNMSRMGIRKDKCAETLTDDSVSIVGPGHRSTSLIDAQQQQRTTRKTTINKHTESLRTMVVNFQSVLPKKEELWQTIDILKPDIIIGTETWLTPDIKDAELFPAETGYTVFRNDRADKYGGVLIATKNELNAYEINKQAHIEAVLVRMNLHCVSLTVGSIYRTPSHSTQKQMDDILHYLDKLNTNDVLWIGGDFNLPDIDWKDERITGHQYLASINKAFIDKARDLGLSQIVDKTTRKNNILDLFLTNRPNLASKCETFPGLSDHDIVIIDNRLRSDKITKPPRTVTIWKKADISAIKEETREFSERLCKQKHTTVEHMWEYINEHLNSMMQNYIPTKLCSTKYHQPWITTKLKRLSRQKQRAWARAKASNLPEHWDRYKTAKKATRIENRKAYQTHVKSLIEENTNKNLWKFIKTKRCDPVGVSPLIEGNTTHTDSKDKAGALNRQFCSVFVSEDYTNVPQLVEPNTQVMPEITITEKGVEKQLSILDPKKACGPDRIPTRLLQLIANEIAPALTKLFQLSLDTGQIPKIWKHAIVQPIFKKGDRSEASNYRPISLTCVCCKLLEHIIRTSITEHLETNNILSNAQHGFRKQRSCVTQLISVIQDLTLELDRGGQTDVVLLDFAKAFDKVPHRRLVDKLYTAGIDKVTLRWIKSFLEDRTQEVVVGGEKSEIGRVTSGVPQGSVLGPTLFLVYINDMPDNIKSNVGLFADDTLLHRRIHTEEDCKILDADLSRLQEWEEKWQMQFNTAKCLVMTVTNKKKPIMSSYHLHGQILEKVNSAKYLGVEISSNMKWSKHISHITAKANKTSAFIHRNLKECPQNVKNQCYMTLVRPILEYASVVWDPHHQKHIDTLEKVQKRAARRTTNNFSSYASASTIVTNLGLELLYTRRKREKSTTMHKIFNKRIAVTLPDSIRPIERNTRGHHNRLTLPRARTDTHLHSFFPSATRIWNDLPPDAAETDCPDAFKRVLSLCLSD